MLLNFYTTVEVVHNHDGGSTLIPLVVFTGTPWETYIAEETRYAKPTGTPHDNFIHACRNGLLCLSE